MSVLSYLPKSLSRSKRRARATPAPPAKKKAAQVVMQSPIPLPGNLKQRLNALRFRHRTVAIVTGLAMLLGALSLLFLAQAACDWWFEFPWIARAGFLIGDLVILGLIYRRQLDGPVRKRLDLAQTALLVEKKWPQLQQSLIASVELTEGRPYSTRGSRQLIDVLLQQARARTTSLNFSEVVPLRALHRWLLAGGVAILATAAVAVVTWPASLALIERLFLFNVPLPTKTIVVPITQNLVVPFGTDVQLQARAQGIIPSHGRVTVVYEGSPPQEFPVAVSTDKPGVFSLTIHNVQNGFRYSFSLNDGHGPDFTVTAKVPPTIAALECEQIYPAYTGLPPQKLAPTELSLLPGGTLKITAVSADPLKSARIVLEGQAQPVEATLDSTATHLEADVPIPAKDVTGFSVHLIDQAGVSSNDETIYPITLVPDRPPDVKIVQPAEEKETITLRAKPPIDFDASDDYGITLLAFKYQQVPPAIAGAASSKPLGPVQSVPITVHPAKEGPHYDFVLDVAAQVPPWKEGDTINYWIEAVDNNSLTGPGISKSERKQFTVISLSAKQAEIFARLRTEAGKIDDISNNATKIGNDVKEAIPNK